MPAIQAGLEVPPHIAVLAEMGSIKSPYTACANLSKWARRAASHVMNLTKKEIASERVGTNVFIGHGRSKAWRDLKDFVQDRLHLPYDEFNRVPVTGFTNIARLSQMLDSAAIAFLVLTAEDEQADAKMHARMNVIHEAEADSHFIRLIRKWLRAGILEEDGSVINPTTGTPQGGIVSPVLANIYLHYALDIPNPKIVEIQKPSSPCLI